MTASSPAADVVRARVEPAPPASDGHEVFIEQEGDGELSAQRDAPVGGQAVLEGVMMRGVSTWAVAVR